MHSNKVDGVLLAKAEPSTSPVSIGDTCVSGISHVIV